MARVTKEMIKESEETLRSILTPGDRIFGVLTHVSSNGMSRRVKVLIPTTNSEYDGEKFVDRPSIRNISWSVARALGHRFNRNEASIVMGGCGYDPICDIAYSLSYVLGEKDCVLKYTWV